MANNVPRRAVSSFNRDDGSGLSGLAHSDSSGQVVARYDEWAATYDADLAAWGYSVPARLAEGLIARLGADATASKAAPVLDAGCGTGLIGRELQHRGVTPIDGIDASALSLREAERTGAYRSLAAMDLSAPLPLRDASYRAVVCGGVLTYLPAIEFVLRELLRVTVPRGWVIATQRTDLWIDRDCDAVMERLAADGCNVEVGEAQPYLPGHDEYADDILVKTITLQRR